MVKRRLYYYIIINNNILKSSLKNIETAGNLNCDLLITHEPVWWDHFDAPGGWREKDPGLKKTKLMEKSGMVVARLHATWDNWPELGIRDSFAKGLGLNKFIAEDKSRYHAVYEIPEQTLYSFAKYIAEKLNTPNEVTLYSRSYSTRNFQLKKLGTVSLLYD